MGYPGWTYQSHFAKLYFEDGRASGLAEGRAAGFTAGRIATLRDMLFSILEARRLWLDEATITRIRSCEDAVDLKEWIRRGVHADTVAEVFD